MVSLCDTGSHYQPAKRIDKARDRKPNLTSLPCSNGTEESVTYAMFLKKRENDWSCVRCASPLYQLATSTPHQQ